MKIFLALLLSVLLLMSLYLYAKSSTSQSLKLLSVQRIWDKASHNAFTDLIFYQGAFFCCFRESDQHVKGQNGQIRILRSEDATHWDSVALLSQKGVDLRDPKFSITPDGRLMISLGGSFFENGEYKGRNPYVAFSDNGIQWNIHTINMPEEWIWGVTWHKNVGYAGSYRFTSVTDAKKPWVLTLLKTTDGLHYEPVTTLDVPDHPSETTLRFLSDETMVALVRRKYKGWIGNAKPPYTNWQWQDSGVIFGGPNFIVLPNDKMWAGSRYSTSDNEEEDRTAIGPLTLNSFQPEYALPSGGDTGYPGMLYHQGILYVSYYSSHEGKSNIYLARFK